MADNEYQDTEASTIFLTTLRDLYELADSAAVKLDGDIRYLGKTNPDAVQKTYADFGQAWLSFARHIETLSDDMAQDPLVQTGVSRTMEAFKSMYQDPSELYSPPETSSIRKLLSKDFSLPNTNEFIPSEEHDVFIFISRDEKNEIERGIERATAPSNPGPSSPSSPNDPFAGFDGVFPNTSRGNDSPDSGHWSSLTSPAPSSPTGPAEPGRKSRFTVQPVQGNSVAPVTSAKPSPTGAAELGPKSRFTVTPVTGPGGPNKQMQAALNEYNQGSASLSSPSGNNVTVVGSPTGLPGKGGKVTLV